MEGKDVWDMRVGTDSFVDGVMPRRAEPRGLGPGPEGWRVGFMDEELVSSPLDHKGNGEAVR